MHILSVKRHYMELCMEWKIKNLLWKKSSLASKSTNTFNWNLLNMICWVLNAVQFSYKWKVWLCQMGLFHQTFVSPALFWQGYLWKGEYKTKKLCSLLLKSICVTEWCPEWDLHWRPICLPSPDPGSSRHTPDQSDGEKQAGGMELSSA